MIRSTRFTLPLLILAALALALNLAFAQPARPVHRYGSVIGVRPEKVDEYRRLHAKVWPGVLHRLRECHIRNYSIYFKEIEPGKYYLFSYFEYTGTDFAKDSAALAADPEIRAWWKLTDPCQIPVTLHKPGENWAGMEEVFHLE